MADAQSMHPPAAAVRRCCTGHGIGPVLHPCNRDAMPRSVWPQFQLHGPSGVLSYVPGASWPIVRLPCLKQSRCIGKNTGSGGSNDRFQIDCAAGRPRACDHVRCVDRGSVARGRDSGELRRRTAYVNSARRGDAHCASGGTSIKLPDRQANCDRPGVSAEWQPVTHHGVRRSPVHAELSVRPSIARRSTDLYGGSVTSPEGLGDRRSCPACAGILIRIARRPQDRLTSLLKPVFRYRCREHQCRWEGTLSAISGSVSRDVVP